MSKTNAVHANNIAAQAARAILTGGENVTPLVSNNGGSGPIKLQPSFVATLIEEKYSPVIGSVEALQIAEANDTIEGALSDADAVFSAEVRRHVFDPGDAVTTIEQFVTPRAKLIDAYPTIATATAKTLAWVRRIMAVDPAITAVEANALVGLLDTETVPVWGAGGEISLLTAVEVFEFTLKEAVDFVRKLTDKRPLVRC